MISLKSFKVRSWTADDIAAIVECHTAVYLAAPDDGTPYNERSYLMQFAAFPEGQLLVEYHGKVVGYSTCIIVQLDNDVVYTYTEITGSGTFSTHDPSGDTLYGADIGVHPDYRGVGIAGLIYKHRKAIMKRYNLRRMVAYGRILNYNEVAGKMTAEEYVAEVIAEKRKDSALNAHLKAGYQVKRVLLDLMWDNSSMNYSTWLEMSNPDFNSEKRKIAAAPISRPVRKIRVCAAQYLMRPITSWEEFEQNVAFFVYTADTYHCHFLVLPELFTVQLFSTMPHDWSEKRAIDELANMSQRYIDMLQKYAMKSNLYIVGGSHPVRRHGELFNVAHFFTPTGGIYTQDKLHISMWERDKWGITPGEKIRLFNTPMGRIAIQISYDIEFPEIARLLTLAGVEVIFVPFSTDDKRAYYRVRHTAQARAVENYIYVVMAGNIGNLPTIRNSLLNYGQAVVLTPSDIAFPTQGIMSEADPNTETVVIADLDITTLAQQREIGSVRPLYDRRPDLYTLRAKSRIEVVQAE